MRKIALYFSVLVSIVMIAWGESVVVTDRMLVSADNVPVALEGGSGWFFKADSTSSSAFSLQPVFDFSQGGRIELEFQDAIQQNNEFPRLIDSAPLSIHLVCQKPDFNQVHRRLKMLIIDAHNSNCQIQIPYTCTPGTWHKVICVYYPKLNFYGVKLDDREFDIEQLTVYPNVSKLHFMLGATVLNNSLRDFHGAIRNVKLTTGLESIEGIGEEMIRNAMPKEETPGITYHVVARFPHRHLAFPGMAVLKNGDYAVVYREGDAHVCPYGRICLTFSKDQGVSWSSPMAVDDTPTDDRDPSIHALSDGRLLITHGGWNSWMAYKQTKDKFPGPTGYIEQGGLKGFRDQRYVFSEDNGLTWKPGVGVLPFCPHGPAIGPDGCFYQPTMGRDKGRRQVYFCKGSPDGTQWERIGLVGETDAKDPLVYEEPHSAFLADGTIATAIRVPYDGYLRMSFSQDQGKTWTAPQKTPLRGYPHHLLQLSDGRLLIVYGYRFTGMGVRACLSRDGGHTWDLEHEIVIRSHGHNADLGYPVAVELPDGRIAVVYYYNTEEHPMPFIELAVLKLP